MKKYAQMTCHPTFPSYRIQIRRDVLRRDVRSELHLLRHLHERGEVRLLLNVPRGLPDSPAHLGLCRALHGDYTVYTRGGRDV